MYICVYMCIYVYICVYMCIYVYICSKWSSITCDFLQTNKIMIWNGLFLDIVTVKDEAITMGSKHSNHYTIKILYARYLSSNWPTYNLFKKDNTADAQMISPQLEHTYKIVFRLNMLLLWGIVIIKLKIKAKITSHWKILSLKDL